MITPRSYTIRSVILSILFFLVLISCQPKSTNKWETIDYSDTIYWYSRGHFSSPFDEELGERPDKPADIFYVYPTVSTISFVDNDSSWFADITVAEVREEANGNQRFNKMLYGEYNFYAPYYRQMIFEAYSQPTPVLDSLAQIAAKDVNDAFQY